MTVFGGSGFLGRYVVERLARQGNVLTIAVRDPEAAKFLRPLGNVGQITPIYCPVQDEEGVTAAVASAHTVINLAGIRYESFHGAFDAVHDEGAARIARAATVAGVRRLVQVSALGAHADALSKFGRSKAAGEVATREAFPGVTLLRPSVIFGPEDRFFNMFASLARCLPLLPLYGGGHTRFQPVYVGDVAAAVIAALADVASVGKTYELGGPRTYSLAELLRYVLDTVGRKRLLLPVPFAIGHMMALILERIPNPLITRDRLLQLTVDSVVTGKEACLADLGIEPTSLEIVVPGYLGRYRSAGAARRI